MDWAIESMAEFTRDTVLHSFLTTSLFLINLFIFIQLQLSAFLRISDLFEDSVFKAKNSVEIGYNITKGK